MENSRLESIAWVLLCCGLILYVEEVSKRQARQAQSNTRVAVSDLERQVDELRAELHETGRPAAPPEPAAGETAK